MSYRAVIFDVDGTLLNTREGILSAVGATLEEFGMRPLKKEDERLFIGPPIQRSLMEVYGLTKEEAQSFANVFRERYSKHEFLFRAGVYDGIPQLMERLQESGIRIAVATYKREDYAVDIVTHFGLAGRADVVHGADNFNKLTKSDIIRLCIEEMGFSPAECVMVGDSDNDAIGAEGIGCPFIGVTYGFGFESREDVQAFKNIGAADTPMEVFEILRDQGTETSQREL